MTAAKETAPNDNTLPELPASTLRDGQEPAAKASGDGRWQALVGRLQRKKDIWLQINGYVIKEIHSDEPVHINTDSTIMGNVFAPKIQIDGTISGTAIAGEIEINSKGEIWGDVFTRSIKINPGGIVHGWVSTVNETELQQMLESGTFQDVNATTRQVENYSDTADTNLIIRNGTEPESRHLLQGKLAVSLAARMEMEQNFERRLSEMAGEAFGTIDELNQQLTKARLELLDQRKQLDEFQELTRQQKSQIDRQTKEITESRAILTEQAQELGDFQSQQGTLNQSFYEMEGEKNALESSYQAILKENEALNERVESLETAHKANLQYQVEQEDSLLRWQELAEITERHAAELETKLNQAEYQLEESRKTIAMLRSQRKDIEKEFNKAIAALANIQGNNEKAEIDPQNLKDASNIITGLETKLTQNEHEYDDQVVWYKANLETSRLELEKSRDVNEAVGSQLGALQDQINQLKEEAIALKADKKNLQTTIRDTNNQLDAAEMELRRYLEETNAQGEHLADIQANLIEREIQREQVTEKLSQALAKVDKQNKLLNQVKQVTTQKIEELQAEITQMKAQSEENKIVKD